VKCQRCGKNAELVYKFDSDGLPRTVSYCKRCLRSVLRDGNKISTTGLRMLFAHAVIVQEASIARRLEIGGNHIDVFIRMPVVVARILFEKDRETDRRVTREIYERQMYLLRKRLDKAVKSEDYKEASKIKEEIQKIQHMMNNI